jgi:galactokinase
MINGNVPIGCGVSSSAALVVSSALASFYANK